MHPVILRLVGSISIRSYGLMLAAAFLTAILFAQRDAKRRGGVDPNAVSDIAVWLLISGILGARLMFVILNPALFPLSEPFNILKTWEGGLVFYGGIIAAVPVGILVLRRKRVDVWQFADIVAPYVALAHAIGRIGCFLNGCCYGKPTNVPWAVSFPRFVDADGNLIEADSAVYAHQLLYSDPPLITPDAPRSLPVHPTQLYCALGLVIICLLLLFLWKRRAFKGQIFWSYVLMYSALRFGIEFFRGDNPQMLFRLTISQLIGIPLFVLAAVLLVRGILTAQR